MSSEPYQYIMYKLVLTNKMKQLTKKIASTQQVKDTSNAISLSIPKNPRNRRCHQRNLTEKRLQLSDPRVELISQPPVSIVQPYTPSTTFITIKHAPTSANPNTYQSNSSPSISVSSQCPAFQTNLGNFSSDLNSIPRPDMSVNRQSNQYLEPTKLSIPSTQYIVPPTLSIPSSSPKNYRSCRHYQNGTCLNGDKCRYTHTKNN